MDSVRKTQIAKVVERGRHFLLIFALFGWATNVQFRTTEYGQKSNLLSTQHITYTSNQPTNQAVSNKCSSALGKLRRAPNPVAPKEGNQKQKNTLSC